MQRNREFADLLLRKAAQDECSLSESETPCSEELKEARRLTPFVTVFRHEELWTEADAPLDRDWMLDRVMKTRAWAEKAIAQDS